MRFAVYIKINYYGTLVDKLVLATDDNEKAISRCNDEIMSGRDARIENWVGPLHGE